MKKRKKDRSEKFRFGVDFQEAILHYTITDSNGLKIIDLYDDTYFTLTTHAIIAYCLKKFFKKKKRMPSQVVFKELLRKYYINNRGGNLVTEQDKIEVDRVIEKIYSQPLKDSDVILEETVNFARYVKFKAELENVDITDYNQYASVADRLKAAQNIGLADDPNEFGVMLVRGMEERAHRRDEDHLVFPTPIYQLNKLLNGGGTTQGNVFMLVSQAKRFKTGTMINLARGYLKKKKKILYVDLENGEKAITLRAEQSMMNQEQEAILSGKFDNRMIQLFKKYRRLGAEMNVKRFPAYTTTMGDIQAYCDKVYLKFGYKFDVVFIDFGDLLGSISGKKEEYDRINDAFVDMKNFADFNKLECLWTASHVTREAGKRRGTKYEQNDLAKCIDKIRHVDCAIGIQENDSEIQNGVQRWEIIDQRNGAQFGKCLFWADIRKQSLKEFTPEQVQEYMEQMGENIEAKINGDEKQGRVKRKSKDL